MTATDGTSNVGRLKVFISYSRKDRAFADELLAALEVCGFEAYLDRQDIAPGEAWEARLTSLIREADTVVYVVSPASVTSSHCSWEVAETQRMAKRLIPVVATPVDGEAVPIFLKRLNFIFFDKPNSFGGSLAELARALNTDLQWLRDHTHLLEEAARWDGHGRPEALLLRSTALDEAKAWQAQRPKHAPEPAALQLDFISASIDAEELRNSRERQQIAEMAAANEAKEKALRKAEDTLKEIADVMQRRAQARRFAALVILGLAAMAGFFAWNAHRGWKSMTATFNTAAELIVDMEGRLDAKGREKAFALFKEGAAQGDPRAIVNLAVCYRDGIGTAKDEAKAEAYLLEAAKAGNSLAMAYLGVMYNQPAATSDRQREAVAWLQRSAALDEPAGMTYLGASYLSGRGVQKDDEQGRLWLERAAKRGQSHAMVLLADLLTDPALSPFDPLRAVELQREAARIDEMIEVRQHNGAGQRTAAALTTLAWYNVLARRYSEALADADRALTIASDNRVAHLNRAHALMLLDRPDEAETIFLAHRGERLSAEDTQLWSDAVAEDFSTLRKLGIESQHMGRILDELAKPAAGVPKG